MQKQRTRQITNARRGPTRAAPVDNPYPRHFKALGRVYFSRVSQHYKQYKDALTGSKIPKNGKIKRQEPPHA